MAMIKAPSQNVITDIRTLLTKLEFAAMEIVDDNAEREFELNLQEILADTQICALKFGIN